MVFWNFLQKMSNEFELVFIRVVQRTPVVPVLVLEQPVINCKVVKEFTIQGVKKKDIHFDLLVTWFCVKYSISHRNHEVNEKFEVF